MNKLVVNFETWQSKSIEDIADNEIVQCPDCEGEGLVATECDCCGHESEDECIACDGSGENNFGSLCGNDKLKVFSFTNYMKEVIEILTKYSSYTGLDKFKVLSDNGFTSFSTINGRYEKIRKLVITGMKY